LRLKQLGTAFQVTRGYSAPEVLPVFQRARVPCERVGEPLQLFAIMWGTWAWHVDRGDYRLCMDLFSGHPRLMGMCRELYDHREWLWTFLELEVEPTNNASARCGMRSSGGSSPWARRARVAAALSRRC
jgi:hypothetical protein